jgi:hypothetical protein
MGGNISFVQRKVSASSSQVNPCDIRDDPAKGGKRPEPALLPRVDRMRTSIDDELWHGFGKSTRFPLTSTLFPDRNHAVEKSVNHGCTRIDTDKNGIRTKSTDGPD